MCRIADWVNGHQNFAGISKLSQDLNFALFVSKLQDMYRDDMWFQKTVRRAIHFGKQHSYCMNFFLVV